MISHPISAPVGVKFGVSTFNSRLTYMYVAYVRLSNEDRPVAVHADAMLTTHLQLDQLNYVRRSKD